MRRRISVGSTAREESDATSSFCLAGIQTSEDARFYGLSAKFDEFSNEGKTLVIQFTVKHEQKIDCGGGYVKVYPADTDQKAITGDSPYHIMFGKRGSNFTLFAGKSVSRFLSPSRVCQVLISVVTVQRKFT